MGEELVDDLTSQTQIGRGGATSSPKSYTDVFNEAFSYYLSIGMGYETFWHDHYDLVIYYRKADKRRIDRDNFNAWLQGRYFYDALCCVAPVMHAFAKKGTKPSKYPEKPYELNTVDSEESAEEAKEKKVFDKGMTKMQAWMKGVNAKLQKGN